MASLASQAKRHGAGPVVLAAALPFLLLHKHYQPSLGIGALDVTLADVAVAAVVIVAVKSAVDDGLAPLRSSRILWLLLALWLGWLVASITWARHGDPAYALGTHLVSAAKFVEYALLAPAVPLILRDRGSWRLPYAVLLGWSAFLTSIATLQFVGVVNEFEGRRPLQREPSYAGIHELGAISGVVLASAFVAIVLALRRRPLLVAAIAGGLGVALAAALDSIGGIVAAAATIWFVARSRAAVPARRTAALAGLVVVVAVAAVALRGTAVTAFLEFLGVRKQEAETRTHVQSYAHRTLLGYIGVKIWLDHPVAGVGWQESAEPAAFDPHLAAAHARFPNEPAQAFPSPQNRWGVQNGVVQTLADLGLVGLGLLLGVLLAAFRLALRSARRGAPYALAALGWLWVTFAVFTGIGLIAGSPIDALLWLAVGLAAAQPVHESVTRPR